MSDCDFRKTLKNLLMINPPLTPRPPKKPIGDGLLITTAASTIVGIYYEVRATDVRQHNALLTSTSLACFMSFPIWKM